MVSLPIKNGHVDISGAFLYLESILPLLDRCSGFARQSLQWPDTFLGGRNSMPCSILVIDDDEVFHYAIKRACKRIPEVKEVMVANHGKIALEMLEKLVAAEIQVPEFILLDVNMPVMNGFEFIENYRHLMQQHQTQMGGTTIAALTSSSDHKDQEKVMATKLVTTYSVKPFELSELSDLIRKVIA